MSQDMLPAIAEFVDDLNAAEIRYCHWKSNWNLEATLAGKTDIDLLIARTDAQRFRSLLDEHGFSPAMDAGNVPFPSVQHYHALDVTSGSVVHVHAYYRIITGESLSKTYRLPLEEMLLQNLRLEGAIWVPTKGAELVLFVIRMLLKHTTPIELALIERSRGKVRQEVDWLMTESACVEAEALLPVWLPNIGPAFFRKAREAIQRPAPIWQRVILGIRLRSRLRALARRNPFRARFTEISKISRMAFYRLRGSKRGLTPAGGGAVIAFVGSEGAGKSTLIAEIHDWLGEHYTVRRIHAGKPPSTLVSALPNLMLPVLRSRLPSSRSTVIEAEHHRDAEAVKDKPFPLLFGVRAVLLARDRKALLARAFRRAANGALILSDRYPSVESGAPDGPQLSRFHGRGRRGALRRWLTAAETRLYATIPAPDVVIYLRAPLEVVLKRNAERAKTEPEDFVRLRWEQSTTKGFGTAAVHEVDNDRPFPETARDVRAIIWKFL